MLYYIVVNNYLICIDFIKKVYKGIPLTLLPIEFVLNLGDRKAILISEI